MTMFKSFKKAHTIASQNQKDDPDWTYTAIATKWFFRGSKDLISYVEIKDETGLVLGNL